jgi:uncharacterized protein
MVWSNFVYKVDLGKIVRLRSSKNLVTIELDKDIFLEIDSVLSKNADSKSKYIDELKKVEIIVDDVVQEQEEFYNDVSDAIEKIADEFTLTITPTLKCNFRCTYCYENGTDRMKDISFNTIDMIFNWVQRYLIDELHIKRIHFKLFGGEPLFVKTDILEYLFNQIDNLNIEYTTGIISNGFFINERNCDIISGKNMGYLQVTLDGPQIYHDKRRMLKNGGPTFEPIINNLELAINKNISEIYIIRVNCCRSNIFLIPDLIDFIANRFFESKDRIVFSFGLVGKSFNTEINRVIDDDSLRLEDGSLAQYVSLYKKVIELGFIATDYYAISALCSNKINDSIIIQSDGNVIKCLRGVGREDFNEAKIVDLVLPQRKINYDLYKKCFEEGCPYIPFCHLGCQHGYFIENKVKNGRNCQRLILNYVNKELLKILY